MESARRVGSPLVVGLDPTPGRLPNEILARAATPAEAVHEFCGGILEAVSEDVAAVKIQSAYFERLGVPGTEIYAALIQASHDLGLPVIADVKRGDIGATATAYAEAHLRVFGAECVTVNPYMGADAVLPFLEEARRLERGGGAFVLVATSNPSSSEIQSIGEPPVYERAARLVAELSSDGDYPDAGAVVGVTHPEIGRRVRELLPDTLFLAPGYGAQGGGASDVRALLDARGGGVLVNSSRNILYAYENANVDYRQAAQEAARRTREELQAAGVL